MRRPVLPPLNRSMPRSDRQARAHSQPGGDASPATNGIARLAVSAQSALEPKRAWARVATRPFAPSQPPCRPTTSPTRVGPHPNATARRSRGEGSTAQTQPLSPAATQNQHAHHRTTPPLERNAEVESVRLCGGGFICHPQPATPVHTPHAWSTVEQCPLCEAPVPAIQHRKHNPHVHPAGQTPPHKRDGKPSSAGMPSALLLISLRLLPNTGTAPLLLRATTDGHAMDAAAAGGGMRDTRSSAAYPSRFVYPRQSSRHTSPHPPGP
jgi:hypothetical protein